MRKSWKQNEVLELGQEDVLLAIEDYRIAKLSWQHFLVAYGELDSASHSVRDAANAAGIANPFDYLLNGLLFDVVLAIARLTEDGSNRGNTDKVTLLSIKARLAEKRKTTTDAKLESEIDAAISQITKFRTSGTVAKIRDRRNSHLAHRLRMQHVDLTYGEIEVLVDELTAMFEKFRPDISR